MFALLLLQFLAGRLILRLLPVVRTGTPPGFYVNLAILVLMIVGLALSLRGGSRVTSVSFKKLGLRRVLQAGYEPHALHQTTLQDR